jgi:hypothetical protein
MEMETMYETSSQGVRHNITRTSQKLLEDL